MKTPVIYKTGERFEIGGSKVLRQSPKDSVTVVGAGITLHQALKAADELAKQKINVRVIDLYSIKPLDLATLKKAASQTKAIITVEDHYRQGGLGEAVASALARTKTNLHILAVTKMPKSGTPEQLLDYAGISAKAIIKKVKQVVG